MTDVCNLCGKLAALMCQRCNETYCSTNCQILDWRVHKKVCFQMPTLIPIKEIGHKDSSSNITRHIDAQLNRTPTDNYKNLKRVQERTSPKVHSEEKLKSNSRKDKDAEPKESKVQPKENDPLMKSSSSQSSKISMRHAAWRTPYSYPEDVFFDVIVQYVQEETGPGIVWVTDVKYEGPLRKLLAEINRNIDVNTDRCSDDEICVGALIAAPFENLFYRAEILQIKACTKSVVAHLIDYGNLIEVPFKDLRSPIPIMRNLNAYAFRIHLDRHVPVEDILTIRVIGCEKNGALKIEEKSKYTCSGPIGVTAETLSANPTVSLVKISDDGHFALLCLTNEHFVEKLSEMNKFLNSDGAVSLHSSKLPKIGDYVVAACSPHGWSRALVMSTFQTHYLVYLVDVGRIELVEQVLPMPERFQCIPTRVFCVKLLKASTGKGDFTDCLFYDKVFAIKVHKHATKLNNGNILCNLLTNEEKVAEVEAFSYGGKHNDIGVKDWFEPLISGSTVYVTSVVSHCEVFISLVCTKVYPRVFSAAAETCEKIQSEKIAKGDLVLAMSEEGKYFRARILDIKSGSVRVLNVDSGHLSNALCQTLRKPNLFVLACPYHTWNVKLMYLTNVATPYADNKALATLEQCQQKAAEFVLKFDSNLEQSAELLLKNSDQQSLNKQLLPLLFEKRNDVCLSRDKPKPNLELHINDPEYVMATPPLSPNNPQYSDGKYMFRDLKVMPITCGDNIPLLVLDVSNVSKGFITACDLSNREFLMKFESEYLPLVKKHCASLKESEEYWPSVDELCLAVYDVDKEWYRALCLNQMDAETLCVMFLDYGNVCQVKKRNVRKIIPELMFPSNANVCILQGVPDEMPQKMCEKFLSAIQADPKIIGKVTKLEQDSYLLNIKDKKKYF